MPNEPSKRLHHVILQIPPGEAATWVTFTAKQFVVRVLATGSDATKLPPVNGPDGLPLKPDTEYWSSATRTSSGEEDKIQMTTHHRLPTQQEIDFFFNNTGFLFRSAQSAEGRWKEIADDYMCVGPLYRALPQGTKVYNLGIQFLFDTTSGRAMVAWYLPTEGVDGGYAWEGVAPKEWVIVPSAVPRHITPDESDWYELAQQRVSLVGSAKRS